MSKPIQQGQQPERGGKAPGVVPQSDIATQGQSSGAILPESFFSYSGFIFLISFAWLSATFDDWSVKQQLMSSIIETITKTSLKTEVNEDMRSTLENYLNMFHVPELLMLRKVLKDFPKATSRLISGAAKDHVKLKNILTHLSTSKGQQLAMQNEQISIGTPEEKIGLERGELSQIESFADTGISNGTTSNGYLYEIHLPFKLPELSEKKIEMIADLKKDIDVIVTDPQKGITRRLSVPFEVKGESNKIKLLNELQKFENNILLTPEFSDTIVKAFNAQVFDRFPVGYNQPEFLENYKKGNIYLIDGKPSLLPNKNLPTACISETDLKKAQKLILKQNENHPTLNVHIPDSSIPVKIPCNINTREVGVNNRDYLELTFIAEYLDKDLSYTTRVPYGENETKDALIERIGQDGSLARAMLMAASAFTREMVP